MIFGLFSRRFDDDTFALYRSIVTEARHPEFYLAYGVPDTVTGRFDMIVLMIAIVLHRLRAEPKVERKGRPRPGDPPDPAGRAQELVDLFFSEMDRSMREMGVGDLSMSKRMKKLAHAWNGRFLAYDAALDDEDETELAAAISRNVLADVADRSGASALASHVLAATSRLSGTAVADVLAGRIDWPAPEEHTPRTTA